ncbi:MAG: branched-chain amino acid transport system permease protein livM, partial [Acidimicrobiia bacterium]|nr:branched-chain amino acid transport system permease protein livM [Acidimicrobiia bacterium]
MNDLTFLLLGLGVGAAYAAVAMGLVVIHNGTGVLNVAQAAIAMWAAFVFDEIRSTGQWILPIGRVPVGHALPTAIVLGVASAAAVALIAYAVVFRPLRQAPALAKLVASVGVMLTLQALVVLRFGSRPRASAPVLPSRPVHLGSVSFSSHVVWLAALAVVIAVVLWAGLRFTRLGLAVRASAQNELGVSLSGFSPNALGALTWGVAAGVTGGLAILAASSTGLNPTAYSLLVVPALAAGLAGRLESPIVACVAALALGSVQAELTNLSSRTWWPSWASVGSSDVVPFVLIVALLFVAGHRLPLRGAQSSQRSPHVRRAAGRRGSGWAALVVGLVALVLTGGSYRFGLITSLSVAVVALSLVLLTGLVGQVSLAQAAFAGVAGFVLSALTHHFGVPFPWSLVLASACSGIVGVLVGLPALRIRGMQLAVVTLAGAVAVEQFVFRNPQLSPPGGHPISDPSLFGLNVAVRRGSHLARLPFGVVVLGVVALVVLSVGRLTRGDTGRTFVAVRANETAAAASGIDVGRAKLAAFALSSFVAGVGGSLIGYSRGQLSADSFTALTGLSFLAWA